MKNWPLVIVSVVLSLLLLGGGLFLLWRSQGTTGGLLANPLGGGRQGAPSGYQAVFLANGQVYFGKLTGFPGSQPLLTDVFYLRTGAAATPTPGEVKRDPKTGKILETPTPAPAAAFTLVKLGEEVHGPADELRLNPDQIIFIEDIRADSQLIAAIKRYKEAQNVKK